MNKIFPAALALVVVSAAGAWGVAHVAAQRERAEHAAVVCPPGYSASTRERGEGEAGACARRKHPESFAEVRALEAARDSARTMPEGALRRAVERKAQMKAAQSSVPNATAHWRAYGSGPQLADPDFPDGSNDGIVTSSGRADSFAYDPAAKRLFVAIAYGGVWMSQAVDGDVATLGNQWTAIGDNLPTLINSAVAWTPARGGRVLSLTGEHVQGGNTYVGLGAYWSDDLGAHWHHAAGTPDATNAGKLAVDPSNPEIVYAATGKGLFRSDDAGESFVNVALPVSADCAGVEALGPCQVANVVTDVVVQQPGGVTAVTCGADGCPVLAAVGFRAGQFPYADGTMQSPGNGLYRSATGKAGSFTRVGLLTGTLTDALGGEVPVGFTPQIRIGRTELGAATGDAQDHGFVYALVQDAVLLNGGIPALDLPTDDKLPTVPIDCTRLPEGDPQFVCSTVIKNFNPTTLNGVYVSPDFGDTWIRLADDLTITYGGVITGSSLAAAVPLGIGPGVQSWYDEWIKPDPTQADPVAGVPTRVAFGLEELWKNGLTGTPISGLTGTPVGFKVFGTYFAGNTCLFLLGNIDIAGIIGLPIPNSPPVCPFRDGINTNISTTHPDQHDGIYIPDDNGGVWLFIGSDGGVWKQHSADPLIDDFDNTKWGDGANQGFHTLFDYGIAVARDGTVYYGLQDNASGKIEPGAERIVRLYVGDGMWAEVDPANSDTAYYQTPGLALVRTKDGGKTNVGIDTFDVGTAHFLSAFRMDPVNPEHLVAAGTKVAETTNASADDIAWTTVLDLGANPDTGTAFQSRGPLAVHGDAVYVGYCGPCNITATGGQFLRGIATNVGGDKPPSSGTPDGWHVAAAHGLPNRYVYDLFIDPQDPRIVYAVLGGYSTARWLPDGQYLDTNTERGHGHVFRSNDAGENFTDISGDLPDVITSAIIRRGGQLIVGTDLGVFISKDLSGAQWAPLGDLPSVPVNRLVVQPGKDNVLFAGTFGRGVQVTTLADSPVTTPGTGSTDAGRFGGAMPLASLIVLMLAGLRRRRARPA
jgi:hypothetical protein